MSFEITYNLNELNHPDFSRATGTYDIGNKNAEKSLDSFHDDLAFEFSNSKPGTLEDIVFENTKIYNTDDGSGNKQIIKNILSSYGNCVVIDESSENDGKIPYRLPNNNECFIKDCFPGFSVPGLNNLLDQSTVSLKTFIDYHKIKNKLENPLKTGNGLHKQLPENFPYTAYFNYDIMIFKHINSLLKFPDINIDTAEEILFINTVNLNFLWCKLLLYCENSVENDKYLKPNANQPEDSDYKGKNKDKTHLSLYKSALKELKKIRFDGFQINADGYISNPLFTMRDQKSKILTDKELNYITKLCNTIYGGDEIKVAEEAQPPIQYITSQSMAATSILKKIGKKIKSVISRLIGSKKKDSNKEACKKKFDDIFKNGGGLEKHGWNILKFSGDSSHIVIGNIIEHISKKSKLNIDIRYLVSERPLAARLLSTQKSVIIFKTNVVMNNFNGPGSENKEHRHAALSVIFDPKGIIENIIKGFAIKYKNVTDDKEKKKYIKTKSDEIEKDFLLLTDVNIGSAETQFALTLETLNGFNDELSQQKDPKKIMTDIFELMNGAKTKELLDVYDIDNAIYDISQISTEFINLAKQAIGIRIGNIRINVKMNWKGLISNLISNNMIIQSEFSELQKVVSLMAFLYKKVGINIDGEVFLNKEEVDLLLTNLLKKTGFGELYKKIKYFYSVEEKRSGFVEDIRTEWQNMDSNKGNSDSIPNNVELVIQEFQNLIVNFMVIFDNNPTRTFGGNPEDEIVEYYESPKLKLTAENEIKMIAYYIEEFLSKEFMVEAKHEYAIEAAQSILTEMNNLVHEAGVTKICSAIGEAHFTERISRYYSEEESELTNFIKCEIAYYNMFNHNITLEKANTLYKNELNKDIINFNNITSLKDKIQQKKPSPQNTIMTNIKTNITLNYKNINEIIAEISDIDNDFKKLKGRFDSLTHYNIVNMVKIRNEYNTFISSHHLLQDDYTNTSDTDRHPRIIEKIIKTVNNTHGGRTRKKRESRKQNKLNNHRQTSKRHRKRRTKRRGKTVQK